MRWKQVHSNQAVDLSCYHLRFNRCREASKADSRVGESVGGPGAAAGAAVSFGGDTGASATAAVSGSATGALKVTVRLNGLSRASPSAAAAAAAAAAADAGAGGGSPHESEARTVA